MTKKNLRQFNPEEIAKFDAKMWQAYYQRKFVRLFFILVRFAIKIHRDFRMSYWNIVRAAYYTVLAAMNFGINRGKENKESAIKNLIKAFKIVERHSLERFDYKKAATLQIEWWLIDRYPTRYKKTREEGIAEAEAIIFNIDPEKLKDYATFRAQALTLQDKAEEKKEEADWDKIKSLLEQSFTALHQAVNK